MPQKKTWPDGLQTRRTETNFAHFINDIKNLHFFLEILYRFEANHPLCLFLPQKTSKSANLRHVS